MDRLTFKVLVLRKVEPAIGTSTAKIFVYHKKAIGYAIQKSDRNVSGGKNVSAEITWHGDRAAYFINHMMSGAAVMIDDTGVIVCRPNRYGFHRIFLTSLMGPAIELDDAVTAPNAGRRHGALINFCTVLIKLFVHR